MLGMFSPYMCEWELKKRPSLAQNKVMQVANQKNNTPVHRNWKILIGWSNSKMTH